MLSCKLDAENFMSLIAVTCWPCSRCSVLRLCLISMAEQHRPGSGQQAGSAAARGTMQPCCMMTSSGGLSCPAGCTSAL